MKIGFYPRYDRLGASSRYRFFMYFDRCIQSGISAGNSWNIYPGMSDDYLRELYQRSQVGKLRQAGEMCHLFKRACQIPRDEKMIIEYELMPHLPWAWERKLIGNRSYILNFDDNVWEKYRDNSRLLDKFDQLCRHAAGVIVAKNFLLEKISGLNSNICLIPTVLDLDKYTVCNDKFEKFTIVWIGTPVTYMYLEQHIEVLRQITADNKCELLVVAAADLGHTRPLQGVNARYVNWSEKDEIAYLQRSHVGIMPLSDDEFSRGKSAFKLLQYQACGLPLIASPVGENKRVVIPGENGFLAESAAEWIWALQKLRSDQTVYDHCSCKARAQAYEYSLQKYWPVFHDFIIKTFSN